MLQGVQDRKDSDSDSEGVNYKIVAVVRLLNVRENDSHMWAQIGTVMVLL